MLREQHLLLSGLCDLCVKCLPFGLAEIRSMSTCFKAAELRHNILTLNLPCTDITPAHCYFSIFAIRINLFKKYIRPLQIVIKFILSIFCWDSDYLQVIQQVLRFGTEQISSFSGCLPLAQLLRSPNHNQIHPEELNLSILFQLPPQKLILIHVLCVSFLGHFCLHTTFLLPLNRRLCSRDNII